MSNLSNLHISGSYRGLINLADSTQGLPSQTGDINLQDGLGNNVGIKINASTNKVTIVNDLQVDGDVNFSGSIIHTGSIDVLGDITASNIRGTIGNFDTINTRLLHVTEESSSVILSSGSNVLGDEDSDTQTFNGSVYIPYNEYLKGNATDTDTRINNKLETSWTSSVFLPFSTSVDTRLVALEDFSSSLVADFVTDTELSSALESVTSSLQAEIDTKLNSSWTSSVFTPFSSSVDSRIISTNTLISNQQDEINSLISVTGSYATTGSNTFDGSNVFSGSVQGEVIPLTITSQTASIDCSQGNFFTLTLPTGSNTNIRATNIVPGLTITLEINQESAGSGDATFSTQTFRFPRLSPPSVTPQSSAKDVATFVSFDTSKLNGVLSNDLV